MTVSIIGSRGPAVLKMLGAGNPVECA